MLIKIDTIEEINEVEHNIINVTREFTNENYKVSPDELGFGYDIINSKSDEKVGKLLKRYEINNCGNQTLAEETIISTDLYLYIIQTW